MRPQIICKGQGSPQALSLSPHCPKPDAGVRRRETGCFRRRRCIRPKRTYAAHPIPRNNPIKQPVTAMLKRADWRRTALALGSVGSGDRRECVAALSRDTLSGATKARSDWRQLAATKRPR
jgi:hypothetical protein